MCYKFLQIALFFTFSLGAASCVNPPDIGSQITSAATVTSYSDGRPAAKYRLDAKDQGVVLRYGSAPDSSDYLGARDVFVFEDKGTYYMHYDGAGLKGWLVCLATSTDLVNWVVKGRFSTSVCRVVMIQGRHLMEVFIMMEQNGTCSTLALQM